MRRSSIGFKLIVPVIMTTVACFSVMYAILITSLKNYEQAVIGNTRELLLDGYRKELRSATEIASSLVAEVYRTEGLSDQAKLELARRMVRPLRFGTDGYFYAYRAGDGLNLIHGLTPSNEGKSLWDLQSPDKSRYIIRDLDAAAKDGKLFVEFFWSRPGAKAGEVFPKLGTALPVPGTDIWVGTGEYLDSINREMDATATAFHRISMTANNLILMVFLLVILLFLATITVRMKKIIRPVQDLSAFLAGTGGTDFSSRVPVRASRYPDELDDLHRNVDDLFVRFSGLIRRTQDSVAQSRSIGEKLKEASSGISGSLDETGKAALSIREGAVRLDEETRRNSSVGRELETFIEDASALAREQVGSVGEASQTIAGMTASISGIARDAESHAETARSLDAAARNGAADIEKMVKLLAVTYENAASIGEVIALIDEIAERTNLLAMNAAIEAAHAGESGRGFAVVASEIKKLAASSSTNAREISGRLKEVASSLKTSNTSAAMAKESFERIVVYTSAVSSGIGHMKESALALDEGRAAIDLALRELVGLSGRVAGTSDEARGKMQGLSRSIEGLAVMSGSTKADLERIEKVLDGIRGQAGQVMAASDQNVAEAASLSALVLPFKV